MDYKMKYLKYKKKYLNLKKNLGGNQESKQVSMENKKIILDKYKTALISYIESTCKKGDKLKSSIDYIKKLDLDTTLNNVHLLFVDLFGDLEFYYDDNFRNTAYCKVLKDSREHNVFVTGTHFHVDAIENTFKEVTGTCHTKIFDWSTPLKDGSTIGEYVDMLFESFKNKLSNEKKNKEKRKSKQVSMENKKIILDKYKATLISYIESKCKKSKNCEFYIDYTKNLDLDTKFLDMNSEFFNLYGFFTKITGNFFHLEAIKNSVKEVTGISVSDLHDDFFQAIVEGINLGEYIDMLVSYAKRNYDTKHKLRLDTRAFGSCATPPVLCPAKQVPGAFCESPSGRFDTKRDDIKHWKSMK